MSMLVYPQLRSGALSQFPIQKRRRLRTVVNNSADERTVRLADPAGQFTEWRLEYSDLADDEIAALQQFCEQAEGTLNGFTFLDPTSNLLAWSDQLDNAVWQRGPLLSIASGASDEAGGTLAWHVTNSGGGAQNLSQTLAAPAGYLYCFSAYVRSAATTTATMLLAGLRHDIAITPGWARVMMAGSAGLRCVRGWTMRRSPRW